MSAILVSVQKTSHQWIANIGSDIVLCIYFYIYCKNCHIHTLGNTANCCYPQEGYVIYPSYKALYVSIVLLINLYGARIPALFYAANSMAADGSGLYYTYNNALLVIDISIFVMFLLAMYWFVSYMLFKKDFTSSPGK